MSDDGTRCLLVGLGGMGRGLIRFLEQKPWFHAVGLVDPRSDALDEPQAALHLPDDARFKDLAQALAATRLDAVIINPRIKTLEEFGVLKSIIKRVVEARDLLKGAKNESSQQENSDDQGGAEGEAAGAGGVAPDQHCSE